jgi:hypothetical protein
VSDCAERHMPQPDDHVSGEGHEGTAKVAL